MGSFLPLFRPNLLKLPLIRRWFSCKSEIPLMNVATDGTTGMMTMQQVLTCKITWTGLEEKNLARMSKTRVPYKLLV